MTKHFVLALAVVTMTAFSATAQTVAPAQPGRPAQQPGQVVQPGQQPAQPGLQPGQPGQQAGAAGQPGSVDQAIAACLALGNQEEIALAQLAASRAKNDRVKEFAQTMQREHTAALQKLQRAAPQLASWNLELQAGGATGQATGVQQAGAPQRFGQQGVQQATSTQPAGAAGADSQVIALQRAIAQQCLALTQRELDEAGEKFDECYIGQQVGAHVGMLAKLQASEQFATGQLRSFIQEATPTVERHLQHAKELAKELKGASASASAQTNAAANRQ